MATKIIAVDFDGTLCEDKYPYIGEPNMSLINELARERKETGAKIILWTCRIGERLDEAVEWCKEHGLIFDAVNENLPEVIEAFGTDTRKIAADKYIDDHNEYVNTVPFETVSLMELANNSYPRRKRKRGL